MIKEISIVGTWKFDRFKSSTTYGYIDPFLAETNISSDIEEDLLEDDLMYFVFRDNDTVSMYEYDPSNSLTNYQHMTYAMVDSTSTLTIYGSGGLVTDPIPFHHEITSLTSTNLNFRESHYEEYAYNPLTGISSDTTFFSRDIRQYFMIKSELPSITTELLSKKKPISSCSSFFVRSNNR